MSKIIIGIGWLKTADINKCHACPIFKALLVSAGLGRSTPLSHVQIQKILFEFAMKSVYFSNLEFIVIYTQDIHKNIHTTSLEFTVHIHNIEKFNS
jgi:hypothetical protein